MREVGIHKTDGGTGNRHGALQRGALDAQGTDARPFRQQVMTSVFDRLPTQKQIAELTSLGPAVSPNGSRCLINACTKGIVITWKRVDEHLDLVHHMRARPEPVYLLQRNDVGSTNRIDNPAEVDLAVTAPSELDIVGHYAGHA